MNTDQVSALVIAAHPDDEVLGCGGTIAKHTGRGEKVRVAILAEGLTSRAQTRDRASHARDFPLLHQAAKRANEILGVPTVELVDFPDNRMDSLDLLEVTKEIEKLIAMHQPTTVYSHHAGDVNIDHRVIHQAVVTACRPQPNHCVKQLLFFEVASSGNPCHAGFHRLN